MRGVALMAWVFITSIATAIGQNQEDFRQYSTMEYMQELKTNEEVKKNISVIENEMVSKLRFAEHRDLTLPIVFHVLFNTDNPDRISKEILQAQLDIVNQDFAGETIESFEFETYREDQRNLAQYEELRADARISFCFPDEEEFEVLNIEETISYKEVNNTIWDNFNDLKDERFGIGPSSPENVINVWVTNLPERNSGYAQMPGGPINLDGIVIDYKRITDIGNEDSPYNGGHTLTHLLANYLGLFPLWGEYDCGDDYVSDTPIHNAPNFRGSGSNHKSACTNYPTEMVNNFMDNTDDECLSIFTKGQIHRMQSMLSREGPRAQLTSVLTDCNSVNDGVDPFAGIEDVENIIINANQELKLFPNPAKNNLHIIYNSDLQSTYEVEVYSVLGQLMNQNSYRSDSTENIIDVSKWEPGLYVVILRDGEKEISKNIIVQ